MKSLKEPLSLLSSTAFTPVAKLAAGSSMIHIRSRGQAAYNREEPGGFLLTLPFAAWASSAHIPPSGRTIASFLPPSSQSIDTRNSVRIRGAERHNAGTDRVLARHTPCRLHVPALLGRKRRKTHFAGVIHCCILVTTSLRCPPSLTPTLPTTS